jgi:cytochrome c-type biogenesis protein CcmE
MKKSYIIGAIIIVAALVLAMFSFKSTLTPYISIAEAKASGQQAQVAGILVPGTARIDQANQALIFALKEPDGEQMTVHYTKAKPANFDNADKIVTIGHFDNEKQLFIADELLVKCPSKYKGRIKEK